MKEHMIAPVANAFTPLELLLISALVAVVGGIVVLARWFYKYMRETNKERANEIHLSVKVQTELIASLQLHNHLIKDLPDRIQDKIQSLKHN